jgi:hypothetical protein
MAFQSVTTPCSTACDSTSVGQRLLRSTASSPQNQSRCSPAIKEVCRVVATTGGTWTRGASSRQKPALMSPVPLSTITENDSSSSSAIMRRSAAPRFCLLRFAYFNREQKHEANKTVRNDGCRRATSTRPLNGKRVFKKPTLVLRRGSGVDETIAS